MSAEVKDIQFDEWMKDKTLLHGLTANGGNVVMMLVFDETEPERIQLFIYNEGDQQIIPLPVEFLTQGVIKYMRIANVHYETDSTVH